MKYENAKRGLGMIYTAEILELIGILLVAAAAFISEQYAAVGIIVSLIALVFVIAGTIRQFKGLMTAKKDEKHYKQAMIMLIVWFAASIVSLILPMIFPAIKSESAHAFSSNLINTLVLISVVQATNALLQKKGDLTLVKKGNIVIILNLVAFWFENLLNSIFSVNKEKVVLLGVTALIYVILALVSYIKYLVYIKKSAGSL